MRGKKICFFINSLNDAGGMQRVTTVIANELIKRNYEIYIVCWMGNGQSFYPLSKAIRVYALYAQDHISIYSTFFRSLFAYRKIINRINPDVTVDVGSNYSLLTIPALIFKKVKRVTWEHFNQNIGKPVIKKATNFLINRLGDKVVLLTNADAAAYRKVFPERKITVIRNPVTIQVDQPSPLSGKMVLAVGRLVYQKGFDLLLKAWKIVALSRPGWILTIVGGGSEELMLKQMTADLQITDTVRFVAPVKNIAAYYKSASIQVISSRYEGLPLTLIEGKAFGLPTISFDCHTGPREVITNGYDGELIEPENTDLLAQAIINLMNNPGQLNSYAGNSLEVAKKFTVAAIMNQWETLFDSI